MAWLKKSKRKGTKGKTARVRAPKRKATTTKSKRSTDVSMPASLVSRPTVAGLAKHFSSRSVQTRHHRHHVLKDQFRRKAHKAIEKGIDATAKIVALAEKIAPVLLLGGGATGAISASTVSAGMLGTQLFAATENLINHTVNEYNKERSPTLMIHRERASQMMNQGIKDVQMEEADPRTKSEGLFERPFDMQAYKYVHRPVDPTRLRRSKNNQGAVELLHQAKRARIYGANEMPEI